MRFLREKNGELRRSSVIYPLVKHRRGNDVVGRVCGSWARGGCVCGKTTPRLGRGFC